MGSNGEVGFSHLDASGRARMVNVLGKPSARRYARAGAFVRMASSTLERLKEQTLPKGDALAASRLAGIQAAKRTDELIPLCHTLGPLHVEIDLNFCEVPSPRDLSGIEITAVVECIGPTGPEMEALMAASTAALTLYDMCKAVDSQMAVTELKLLEKRGGKSDDSQKKVGSGRACAVVTLSDRASAGRYTDESGRLAAEMLEGCGFSVAEKLILPDEKDLLTKTLKRLCDQARVDLVVTSGGTGLSPRDITPEATASVIEKIVQGIPEALRTRFQGYHATTSLLSRSLAGVRGRTLIVNLPGKPSAVQECLSVLIPCLGHAFQMMNGDGHEPASKNGRNP